MVDGAMPVAYHVAYSLGLLVAVGDK